MIEEYNRIKQHVSIPPGHIILFYENIIHEVFAKKMSVDSYRLFLGWRMTYEEESMIPILDTLLEHQAIIPVKSGQMPDMWSSMHWMHWRPKLQDYSKPFRNECKEYKVVTKGADSCKKFHVVIRELKSLKEYNLPLFKKYSDFEKKLYKPHKYK